MRVGADVVGGPALPRVHAEQQHVDRAVEVGAALGVGLAGVAEQVALGDVAGGLADQPLAADDARRRWSASAPRRRPRSAAPRAGPCAWSRFFGRRAGGPTAATAPVTDAAAPGARRASSDGGRGWSGPACVLQLADRGRTTGLYRHAVLQASSTGSGRTPLYVQLGSTSARSIVGVRSMTLECSRSDSGRSIDSPTRAACCPIGRGGQPPLPARRRLGRRHPVGHLVGATSPGTSPAPSPGRRPRPLAR